MPGQGEPCVHWPPPAMVSGTSRSGAPQRTLKDGLGELADSPAPAPEGHGWVCGPFSTCLLFRFTRIGLQSVQLPTLRAPSKLGGNQTDRPPDPRLGARPTKRQTEPGRHPPSPAFCVTAVGGSRPGPTPRQPSACSGDRGKQSPQSMEADDPSTWHCPEPPLNTTCPRGAGRLPVPADGDGDR